MIYDMPKLMTMVMIQLLVTWLPFLCGCPELCRKQKTLTMFRLICLCIGHFPPFSPSKKFGSALAPSCGPEFSEFLEPVQSFFCFATLRTTVLLMQVLLVNLLSFWIVLRVPHFTVVTMFGRISIPVTRNAL